MTKISDLPAGTVPTGIEKIPAVQGGITVELILSQFNTYVAGAVKTLTNTTFDTAATGNSLLVNGLAATANTGTGAVVRDTSPTLNSPILVTAALGTPASGIATNLTGTAAGLTAGNVTTNANLTGVISSVGNVTSIGSQTGTGSKFVVDTSPTLVTPILGVATLTSANKVTITAPATSATLTLIDGTVLTGPASSGTVMTLGNAETITGVKTYGSAGAVGRLKIAGTTSGSTVLDATAIASGTIQLPAASGIVVLKDTPDVFLNKTLDSAGTGNSIQVGSVALSKGQYPGETTTGSATAGNVGEYVSSNIASGSAVSLTTVTAANVTSISLTAGDWDVQGKVGFLGNAATTVTRQVASISATTATLDNTNDRVTRTVLSGTPYGVDDIHVNTPVSRFSLSGTTTVFLVAFSAFAVSTSSAYGEIRARRVR